MDVINRLNELRLKRNLSVYRLAELSGLNQSTLANTFSRGTVPSIKNLECICGAMGITLAQFFTEDEVSVRMTREEKILFENYKKLPEKVKDSVKNIVNTIADSINE